MLHELEGFIMSFRKYYIIMNFLISCYDTKTCMLFVGIWVDVCLMQLMDRPNKLMINGLRWRSSYKLKECNIIANKIRVRWIIRYEFLRMWIFIITWFIWPSYLGEISFFQIFLKKISFFPKIFSSINNAIYTRYLDELN